MNGEVAALEPRVTRNENDVQTLYHKQDELEKTQQNTAIDFAHARHAIDEANLIANGVAANMEELQKSFKDFSQEIKSDVHSIREDVKTLRGEVQQVREDNTFNYKKVLGSFTTIRGLAALFMVAVIVLALTASDQLGPFIEAVKSHSP